MTTQQIPLRVHGQLRPPPSRRKIWQRGWRDLNWQRFLIMVGLALAIGGAYLTVNQPSVPVYVDNTGYHVGDMVMRKTNNGTYTGNAALDVTSDGTFTKAGASTTYNGVPSTGYCVMSKTTEHCVFTIGNSALGSDDQLEKNGDQLYWDRLYDDHFEVKIALPGGSAVPVPLPIGK